jgi:hypothetical protein
MSKVLDFLKGVWAYIVQFIADDYKSRKTQ